MSIFSRHGVAAVRCAAMTLTVMVFISPPARAQASDNYLSETGVTESTGTAPAEEADQYNGGAGLHSVGGEGGAKDASVPDPEIKDKVELKQLFASCQAQDVGTDALWKYPSESWASGAAFIPPRNACKTAEILDAKGQKTGKFRIVRNYISGIYMCEDKGCQKRLNFETVGFGEYCVWRVHRSLWQKSFGGRPFGVVMVLTDGRFIRWDLKDPSARNGMPPYPDLKYKVAPYCYRPLY